MIVNNTTQTEYIQRVHKSEIIQKTNSTFKVDDTDNSDENNYAGYEQYIKNYSKILETTQGLSKEEAIEKTKGYIDNPEIYPSFFPIGANLTDEFTESFIET